MNNKISVVVPAYNRGWLIRKTIESLINQSLAKENYEIIVVDNNSTDNTREVVQEIIQKTKIPKIRYVLEKRQGVHWARNRGAKEAENEILYFTDDDMLADRNLLEEILKVFDYDSNIGSVGGVILLKFEVNPPQWMLKHCSNFILGLNPKKEKDIIISSEDIGVFSGHQAIKKKVFFQAGGFNPENTKGVWLGDGETGLNQKIKKLNYKFAFTNKSISCHLIPKERLNQKFINKRLANQGNADSYTFYRGKRPGKIKLFFQILKHILKGLYFLKLAILFKILGNSEWHLRWAWVFYWIARIKYDWRLIEDKEWQKLVLKSNWLAEV